MAPRPRRKKRRESGPVLATPFEVATIAVTGKPPAPAKKTAAKKATAKKSTGDEK